MKKGLTIIDDSVILFHPIPKEEIGISMYCPGFSVELDNIRVIAICPRLPLDDERLFILLIDKQGKQYPMPDTILTSEEILAIESKFGIESIRNVEWEKFDYNEHYGFKAKVIYPESLYGKRLYRKPFDDWKAFREGMNRLIGTAHSTSGVFTTDIEKELA